jgi:hypothetical protein
LIRRRRSLRHRDDSSAAPASSWFGVARDRRVEKMNSSWVRNYVEMQQPGLRLHALLGKKGGSWHLLARSQSQFMISRIVFVTNLFASTIFILFNVRFIRSCEPSIMA